LPTVQIIRLSGYILEEKLAIATKFLLPTLLRENGLTKSKLAITKAACRDLALWHGCLPLRCLAPPCMHRYDAYMAINFSRTARLRRCTRLCGGTGRRHGGAVV
jgi:hypothetical protein